ncbi:hypothetical protein BD414DRAFT_522414 [Trametes punicea]|nr:hypothetical protein BD414DRAFT_522414 [Trametes punicea]
MLKRPRDVFDTPDSSSPPRPASKRRFFSSSSAAGSSPATAHSVSLSTPYTLPYFRSPFSLSVPHDSPSNPFGLNRVLRALTLPRSTGFSKHIVLRMQLVCASEATTPPRTTFCRARPLPELAYRVVQVPLNYSFRLLHMLLLFLFASDAHLRVRPRKGVSTRNMRKRVTELVSSDANDVGKAPGEGHLFEVFEHVRVYPNVYRPGVIKAGTGKLYARLSSTRERKLFPDEQRATTDDEDVFGGGGSAMDDEDGWDWEAEDDFLLSNVWTDGPDLKKAIIYHHTPSIAIHITVNQTRVPPRKGIGNTPHVFAARGGTAGAVRIANVAPPVSHSSSAPPSNAVAPTQILDPQNTRARKRKRKRRSSSSSSGSSPTSSSSSRSRSSSSSGSDWDSDSDEREGKGRASPPKAVDEGEEVPELGPHEKASEAQLERWNARNAFDRFLRREAARERAMRRPPQTQHSDADPRPVPSSTGPSRARQGAGMSGSSPIASRGRTHVYGRRYDYAGRRGPDRVGMDVDEGPADVLPPSSPSTLPIAFPSECDELYTDTDGEHALAFPSACKHEEGEEGREGVEGEDEAAAENMRYMIELPLQTPLPAHPAARRRVRRASERLERQVSRGLSEMSDDDEAEGEGENDGEGAGDGEGATAGSKDDRVKRKADAKAARDESKGRKAKGISRAAGRSAGHAQTRGKAEQRGRPAAAIKAVQRAKGKGKVRSTAAAAPPTPESGSDDSGGSAESVEVDGCVVGAAAPWLRMRGPEDGSGHDGGRWDSAEEV